MKQAWPVRKIFQHWKRKHRVWMMNNGFLRQSMPTAPSYRPARPAGPPWSKGKEARIRAVSSAWTRERLLVRLRENEMDQLLLAMQWKVKDCCWAETCTTTTSRIKLLHKRENSRADRAPDSGRGRKGWLCVLHHWCLMFKRVRVDGRCFSDYEFLIWRHQSYYPYYLVAAVDIPTDANSKKCAIFPFCLNMHVYVYK